MQLFLVFSELTYGDGSDLSLEDPETKLCAKQLHLHANDDDNAEQPTDDLLDPNQKEVTICDYLLLALCLHFSSLR